MESSKITNTSYELAVLKAKVAQICDHVGYNAITQDSSNILVDIYQRLIRSLGLYCKEAANNNYRSESTLIDLVQACDVVGISINSLQEHVETVKLPLKLELQQSDDKDPRPSNRIQRNLLVDDLLESEKNNNQDDKVDGSENQQGLANDASEDAVPLVALLKDTYQEITSKFEKCEPVVADKKIRLGSRIVLPLVTKLKINAAIPPEPSTSTADFSASNATKADKKEKKRKVDRKKTNLLLSDISTNRLAKNKKAERIKKIERKEVSSKSELSQDPPLETSVQDEEVEEKQQVVPIIKKEEKKRKIVEGKRKVVPARSKQPVARQTKGKRGKKLSREFVLPEDDIDDEQLNTNTVPSVVTPLDLAVAEPPSFLPILDIKSEPDISDLQLQIDLAPPSPTSKATTSLLDLTKDKLTSSIKQQKGKKKNKKANNLPLPHVTPLDPAIAEPPSFFPILKTTITKHEPDLPLNETIKTPDKPSTSLLRPLDSTTTTSSKQPKSKKKKKKSSGSQFAIVSETVVAAEEKEWFCPACGGPDDGDLMVQCDKCQEWYHLGCTSLQKPPDDDENWECEICINKIKLSQKKVTQPASVNVSPKPTPPSIPVPIPSHTTDQHPIKTPEPNMMPTSLLASQPDSSLIPSPVVGTATIVQDPDLCPECSLADDGTLMIQCDDPFCARWFHGKCVNLLEEPKEDESWFCKACVEKQQSAFKRRRRK